MKLTLEQETALNALIKGIRAKTPVQTLGGYAGSGKSTLVSKLIETIPNAAVCAYTGKAASILRRKGVNASTIHRLIYEAEWDEETRRYHFHKKTHLGCPVIIVDESSMVGREIYQHLLSFSKPVVFVGDHGQLEPVGSDKFNVMENPEYRLETIHRNAGEISHFAEWIRNGNQPSKFPCNGNDQIQFLTRAEIKGSTLPYDVDQILCAYNKTRVWINEHVRLEPVSGDNKKVTVGEKVICLCNNYEFGVFNGMQAYVTAVDVQPGAYFLDLSSYGEEFIQIPVIPEQFGEEKTPALSKDYRVPFDYAYCVTCHKCVHPDTIVESNQGLLPIRSLLSEGVIATPEGPRLYKNFVENPSGPAIAFRTEDGYTITVTPDHKMEVWGDGGYEMRDAETLVPGDWMRLKLGVTVIPTGSGCMPVLPGGPPQAVRHRTPTDLDLDLAEFFGLMVADGSVWRGGFRLAKRHSDVVERFATLCATLFGVTGRSVDCNGTPGCEVSSTLLAEWMHQIGGLDPEAKAIPQCILQSDLAIQERFLRGLFEDGWANLGRDGQLDHIGWYSSYPEMMRYVRIMLLRSGIISGTIEGREDTHLVIYGRNAIRFAEQIGFVSAFKQDRLVLAKDTERYYRLPVLKDEIRGMRRWNGVPEWNLYAYQNAIARGHLTRPLARAILRSEIVPQSLRQALEDRLAYHHVKIVSATPTTCPSMCVEVPDGHRFLQNGFPHGNSQGDEWDKIMVLEQKCPYWDHRRWVYTAASRARENVFWVTGF